MNRLNFALIAALVPMGAWAQVAPLDEYRWVARPIVVFADSPLDPRVAQQVEALEARQDELDERDVIVIVDTEAESDLRRALRPRDFQFVLIGKDGQVKYRKPDPVSVREIIRLIDRMPLRLQEIGRD
jgi:hypothetical protein